jgi:hypothetical protein
VKEKNAHASLDEGENGLEELSNELSVELVVGEPGSSSELDRGSEVEEHVKLSSRILWEIRTDASRWRGQRESSKETASRTSSTSSENAP